MEEVTSKMKETLNLSRRSVALPPYLQKYEVTHTATTNSATWREALAASNTPPNGYLLTKTLVFKPKVAKTQTAKLIVVVALDDTATSASQIAKVADEKEARFANPDAVKETLGVTVEQGFLRIANGMGLLLSVSSFGL
jgi:prolyl-tRNA editing enzyme YbaK/EbsC (Cys-tRNA(Pro) deacylase)